MISNWCFSVLDQVQKLLKCLCVAGLDKDRLRDAATGATVVTDRYDLATVPGAKVKLFFASHALAYSFHMPTRFPGSTAHRPRFMLSLCEFQLLNAAAMHWCHPCVSLTWRYIATILLPHAGCECWQGCISCAVSSGCGFWWKANLSWIFARVLPRFGIAPAYGVNLRIFSMNSAQAERQFLVCCQVSFAKGCFATIAASWREHTLAATDTVQVSQTRWVAKILKGSLQVQPLWAATSRCWQRVIRQDALERSISMCHVHSTCRMPHACRMPSVRLTSHVLSSSAAKLDTHFISLSCLSCFEWASERCEKDGKKEWIRKWNRIALDNVGFRFEWKQFKFDRLKIWVW